MHKSLAKLCYWLMMFFITIGAVILLLVLSRAFQPKYELLEITEPGNYIRLVVGGCAGPCPIYSITIRDDGKLRFYGYKYTQKLGEVIAEVPPQTHVNLSEYYFRNDFAGLPDCLLASTAERAQLTLELSMSEAYKKVTYGNCSPSLATDFEKAYNQPDIDRFMALFNKLNHRMWLML